MHSDDDKTQQEPALPIQSEVQDYSPKVTGTGTIIITMIQHRAELLRLRRREHVIEFAKLMMNQQDQEKRVT